MWDFMKKKYTWCITFHMWVGEEPPGHYSNEAPRDTLKEYDPTPYARKSKLTGTLIQYQRYVMRD